MAALVSWSDSPLQFLILPPTTLEDARQGCASSRPTRGGSSAVVVHCWGRPTTRPRPESPGICAHVLCLGYTIGPYRLQLPRLSCGKYPTRQIISQPSKRLLEKRDNSWLMIAGRHFCLALAHARG